jgi:hypothetical protein
MFKLFNRLKPQYNTPDKIFDAQSANIQGIARTQGFRELVMWWENEIESIEGKIERSVDPQEVYLLTKEKNAIKKHYLFLKNICGNESTEGELTMP